MESKEPFFFVAQLIPFIKLLLWNRLIHQPIAIFYGQIIAISHDLGLQKVASWKGNPLIQGKSMLLNYYSLARSLFYCFWDTFIKFFVCQHCVSSSTFNPVPPLKKDTHTHRHIKRNTRCAPAATFEKCWEPSCKFLGLRFEMKTWQHDTCFGASMVVVVVVDVCETTIF